MHETARQKSKACLLLGKLLRRFGACFSQKAMTTHRQAAPASHILSGVSEATAASAASRVQRSSSRARHASCSPAMQHAPAAARLPTSRKFGGAAFSGRCADLCSRRKSSRSPPYASRRYVGQRA
eukprot:6213650-Pleurochrysis_carterae.AAC.1